MRIFSDLSYVGTLGILGDALDAAIEGRMWKWAVGPTWSDLFTGTEAMVRGQKGEFLTRELPGALGIPYKEDIFETGWRELKQMR